MGSVPQHHDLCWPLSSLLHQAKSLIFLLYHDWLYYQFYESSFSFVEHLSCSLSLSLTPSVSHTQSQASAHSVGSVSLIFSFSVSEEWKQALNPALNWSMNRKSNRVFDNTCSPQYWERVPSHLNQPLATDHSLQSSLSWPPSFHKPWLNSLIPESTELKRGKNLNPNLDVTYSDASVFFFSFLCFSPYFFITGL